MQALGALEAARQLGIVMPSGLSVMSFDDTLVAANGFATPECHAAAVPGLRSRGHARRAPPRRGAAARHEALGTRDRTGRAHAHGATRDPVSTGELEPNSQPLIAKAFRNLSPADIAAAELRRLA
ncbi:hypothetical protein [Streptomyces hyaluromycini]|uniref:hypothetical protein n=1 Tax=Streptomyces hyaluromycini TaxID=1377993 RepID=UPI001238244A|nr:hypothetical protein [Streptomyces hyaluromycini]